MKKLVLSVLAVILLCSMAIGISAAEWENPFKDVKESHWYYDAVKTTVEKGIFSGVANDRFDPNGKMTRAMFMRTLYQLVGVEDYKYTGTPFTDVKEGAWYAEEVQWAYDNQITSGMSDTRFGVNDPITREQMVTLFYNTAAKYGADTEVTDTYKFDKTYDAAKIREYAVTAMKWAMQNSIISGTGVNGKQIVVDPWGTATRAQAAQIITKYLEFTEKDLPKVTGLTINGKPIEDFTIVYGSEGSKLQNHAQSLQKYIKNATGITLDVTDDSQEPAGPEILVGKTNRESMGLVSVKRTGADVCSFEMSVQGDYFVIAGKDDVKRPDGTEFGVIGFALEILDIEFYSANITVYNTVRGRDIPDGYFFEDEPGYEYRVVYWGSLVSNELRTGEPFRHTGYVHNICDLVGFGDSRSADPCLTDEKNLATIEENFLAKIGGNIECIWVSQNDTSNGYCKCANCSEVYRRDGGRSATFMHLCNRLAEAAEKAGRGDVDIWTLAYEYTIKPCNFQLDDNVVVYFAPINSCTSHTYEDETCRLNKSLCQDLEGWDAITKKLYVWDYSTNFSYSQTPMPLTSVFRKNKAWFYSHGIRGEFNNALDSRPGEFDALKAYILAELQWDPTMSEETYRDKIASFLDAYYGPGGKYINQYINLTEELSSANCFGYSTLPSSVIANDVVIAHAAEIEAMWDGAEALCENDEQLKNIQRSRVSWTYMYLDAVYESMYTNGTDETKAEYVKMATDFYNGASQFKLRWSEMGGSVANFDPQKSPISW